LTIVDNSLGYNCSSSIIMRLSKSIMYCKPAQEKIPAR